MRFLNWKQKNPCSCGIEAWRPRTKSASSQSSKGRESKRGKVEGEVITRTLKSENILLVLRSPSGVRVVP